jgi:hypothetical protein
MLHAKRENSNWAKETTRTRCGFKETATTLNVALWLLLKSHNAFWHLKKCHDVIFVLWLVKKTTRTRCGIMKIRQRIVVVLYNGHDAM